MYNIEDMQSMHKMSRKRNVLLYIVYHRKKDLEKK